MKNLPLVLAITSGLFGAEIKNLFKYALDVNLGNIPARSCIQRNIRLPGAKAGQWMAQKNPELPGWAIQMNYPNGGGLMTVSACNTGFYDSSLRYRLSGYLYEIDGDPK